MPSNTPIRRSRRQRGLSAPGATTGPTSIRATARLPYVGLRGESSQSVYNLRQRRIALSNNAATRHRRTSLSSDDNTESSRISRRRIHSPSPVNVPSTDSSFSVAESLRTLNDGGTLYHTLDNNDSILSLQSKFLDGLTDHPSHGLRGFSHCPQCKERWFDTHLSLVRADNRSRQCTNCHESIKTHFCTHACNAVPSPIRILSAQNDMDPYVRYDHLLLPPLNTIEEMLIAWVHPFMRVFRLDGGMLGYKGNVANLEQDTKSIISALPLLPHEVPCVIVRKPNTASPTGYRDFKVSHHKLMTWLRFLKLNNKYYANIDLDIARHRCARIPQDGSIIDAFQTLYEGMYHVVLNTLCFHSQH